jgi:hypothetical protein
MFREDYILRGKHATYAKNLVESTEKLQGKKMKYGVIRYGIDLIQIAPLIAAAYRIKKPLDKETADSDRYTIQANAVIKQQENLENIFRLILLTDEMDEYTSEELIKRAFKEDEIEEKAKQNMEIFNSYVRGGIEFLHDTFSENATTEDDCLNEIKNIFSEFNLSFIK